MKISMTRELLLASTIVAGLGFAAPAFAQTAANPAAKEAEVVVVTGTRIRRPNTESTSPISTVGAADLQRDNIVNVESQLRILPQFVSGRSQFDNNSGNGTPGTATVNLRALGTERTLVLMDGKRMTPFGATGVVDINQVPLALIERVDVVTGGASAVYGSDAVAGVVNFVLKQNFEGIQFDATANQYGEGDGLTQQFQGTMGTNFADDRGNIAMSIGYTKREAVFQGDRAYSTYNLDPSKYGIAITDPSRRIGSSNAAATRFAFTGAPGTAFTGNRWFAPDGSIVTSAGLPTGTGGLRNSSFNYNPQNYFQTPQERYQATAIGRYQINDAVEAYARAMFVSSDVPTQLAPSAYFGGSTTDFRVNLDNPFLSAAARQTLIGYYNALNPTAPYNPAAAPGSQTVPVAGIRRRFIELGPRNGVGTSDTFQIMGGFRGDLAMGWSWDVSGSFGQSRLLSGTTGDVSVARARQALLAVSSPNGPVCVNPTGGCVPINIFSGAGGVDPSTGLPATGVLTPAAIAFVAADYFAKQQTNQKVMTASLSGGLGENVKSPFAATEISIALGAEYRRDDFEFQPDDLTRVGGAMGQGGTSPPQIGSSTVKELFGEVSIPLIEDKPFAQNLGLELGVRATNSNTAGDFSSWKAGGDWSPVSGIRVRAMLQRAVRAPNLDELFAPNASGLTGLTVDPCQGAAPVTNSTLRQICLSQGAPASRIGLIDPPAAGQAASVVGGAISVGSSLEPEKADTLTVGFVVTPSIVPGLTASVDYYNIDIAGAIDTTPTQFIIDNCFVNNQANFCALITRNPVTGNLEGNDIGVKLSPGNIGALVTRGIDYTVSYTFDLDGMPLLGDSKLRFDLLGTHYLESSNQPVPGADTVECAGKYGSFCGEPTPTDKFTLRAGLTFGDADVSLAWRRIGEVKVDSESVDFYEVESIDAFNYFDLAVRYELTSAISLSASVTNLLEEEPPLVGDLAVNGVNTSMGTFANTYDPLGRVFGIGLSAKF